MVLKRRAVIVVGVLLREVCLTYLVLPKTTPPLNKG